MLETKSFFEPTWQNSPLFEKGPLFFLMLVGSLALFGESEASLRLPSVFCALLFLVALYASLRNLGYSVLSALLSVILVFSLHIFFFLARRPVPDIPAFSLAMLSFYFATRNFGALSGFFMALASLSKIAAPIPFLIPVFLVLSRKQFVYFFLASMITFLPWHIFMCSKYGLEFLRTYFGYHLIERTFHPLVGTEDEPIYTAWLIEMEGLGFLVCVIMCILAFFTVTKWRDFRSMLAPIMLLSGLFPLLLVRTHLPQYLLLLVPGFGVCVASSFDYLLSSPSLQNAKTQVIVFLLVSVLCFYPFSSPKKVNLDFSPDTKAICANFLATYKDIFLFELYDTCIPWYCKSRIKFVGVEEGFVSSLSRVPMLQGFIYKLDNDFLARITSKPIPIVTRPDRLTFLKRALKETLMHFDRITMATRVILVPNK